MVENPSAKPAIAKLQIIFVPKRIVKASMQYSSKTDQRKQRFHEQNSSDSIVPVLLCLQDRMLAHRQLTVDSPTS
jgi:hypothetical protein